MWGTGTRQAFKQALSLTKVKILYARITLTRITTLYFVFTVVSSIILSALQGVTFKDNSDAISAIGLLLGDRTDTRLVVLEGNTLRACDRIPNQSGTNCTDVLVFGADGVERRALFDTSILPRLVALPLGDEVDSFGRRSDDDDDESDSDDDESDSDDDESDSDDDESDSDDDDEDDHKGTVKVEIPQKGEASTGATGDHKDTVEAKIPPNGEVSTGATDNQGNTGQTKPASGSQTTIAASSRIALDDKCMLSLKWLDDTIHDAQREDIVTFGFQLWLFVLAVVTILNESIPHLIAGLVGHVLGTAWSAYRIQSTTDLKHFYENSIKPQACGNFDAMGDWWDVRIAHAIPVTVMNAFSLIVLCALSYKLFGVYANESFSRVGASAKVHRMYKIVLLFSVSLQLSGFLSIASTAMWIDRICHGSMMALARHGKIYGAAFIVTLVFTFPWFYLGWVCVRKECKKRFIVFIALSLVLITISTVMFISPLYVYVFVSWRLFGAMSAIAYALSVVTTALAVLCRLNFGKGLAHYLQTSEALEGIDFTPVVFSKSDDGYADPEKYSGASLIPTFTAKSKPTPAAPPPTAMRRPVPSFRFGSKRGSSVYSDKHGAAVYLSSTPPLVSELAPAPRQLSAAARARVGPEARYPALKDMRASVRVDADAGGGRESVLSVDTSVESAVSLSSAESGVSAGRASPAKKMGLPENPRSNKKTKPLPF